MAERLTSEAAAQLALQACAGNRAAINRLLIAFRPMAKKYAAKAHVQWPALNIPVDEIEQAILIQMSNGIRQFDPAKASIYTFMMACSKTGVFQAIRPYIKQPKMVSLQAPLHEDSTKTIQDHFIDGSPLPDEEVSVHQLSGEVQAVLANSKYQDPRSKLIIQRLMHKNITTRDIGRSMGVSRQRIEQNEKILKKQLSNSVTLRRLWHGL